MLKTLVGLTDRGQIIFLYIVFLLLLHFSFTVSTNPIEIRSEI